MSAGAGTVAAWPACGGDQAGGATPILAKFCLILSIRPAAAFAARAIG